jgi:hypothetical protein
MRAVLDIKHSECWNREVLRSLVEQDPRVRRRSVKGLKMIAYAQRILAGARFIDGPCFRILRPERGIIEERPARYVLKSNGPDLATVVGRQSTGGDVQAVRRLLDP